MAQSNGSGTWLRWGLAGVGVLVMSFAGTYTAMSVRLAEQGIRIQVNSDQIIDLSEQQGVIKERLTRAEERIERNKEAIDHIRTD